MYNLIPFGIVIVLAAIGVLGDYYIKTSGSGPAYINYTAFFIGMGIYAATAVGWFYVMKHIKLAELGVLYALTTAILLAAVAVIFFREQLNVYDIIGIILGIVSIVILARFG